MRRFLAAAALALCCVLPTGAVDFQFHALADARLVFAPNDDGYLDGGLGKLRYGEDDGHPRAHLGHAIGEGRAQILPELMATATTRLDPDYGPGLDLLEAYLRYRPAPTGAWRWSVKAGAFFPPVPLENDEIGWTSHWTLTPSAIDSWVGAELRVIGAEGTLEWDGADSTVTLIGGLFGDNDPAGVMMADRGWNFDDRVTGLFEKSRLPDAYAALTHQPTPLYTSVYGEIDNQPGWYLDLRYEPQDWGGFEIMRYDNDADASRSRNGLFAWHTDFWNFGLRKQIDALTLLAQAMTGKTTVEPPGFRSDTDFKSAYLLAGWQMENWWFAARADVFQTRTGTSAGAVSPLSEDGSAGTVSVSWQAKEWLRLTGELLQVDSRRGQRSLTGDAPRQSETQFQLAGRFYL